MTGPDHYANAESDLDHAARASDMGRLDDMTYWLGCAQVHATLALAAAVGNNEAGRGQTADESNAWYRIAGTRPEFADGDISAEVTS